MSNKIITIYGFHAVESAMLNDRENVSFVYIEKGRSNNRAKQLLNLIQKYKIPYKSVNRDFLDRQTNSTKHQGVTADYNDSKNMTEFNLSEILKKENVFLLILDNIQDPHNLGACLRSANAAGVDAVIAPKDRAVGLTPAVRKIASGAEQNTPFIQVSNLAQTIEKLKKENVWCFGLAGEVAQEIYKTDLTGRLAIVMGGEEKGLRRLTRESCDSLMKIPMKGDVESLNVSVACGIALFEALRQRS